MHCSRERQHHFLWTSLLGEMIEKNQHMFAVYQPKWQIVCPGETIAEKKLMRTCVAMRRGAADNEIMKKQNQSVNPSYGNSNKTESTRLNGGLIPSDWCQYICNPLEWLIWFWYSVTFDLFRRLFERTFYMFSLMLFMEGVKMMATYPGWKLEMAST